MPTDFDNLIRNARPTVLPTARERVLEHIEAHGAVASSPGPFRMVARVAALVVLALASGAVAALFAPKPATNDRDIAELRERTDRLNAALPASTLKSEVARLESDVAALEDRQADYERDVLAAVEQVIEERELARMEQWRERHVSYVREHYTREAEATVSALREELALTAEQEVQVRELLKEAEDKAVALIGGCYGKGRHHDVHEKFAGLASDTERDLQALLDAQQREQIEGAVIVSSAPEDWAPSGEFRDGTDVDVWMNWMNVSRD